MQVTEQSDVNDLKLELVQVIFRHGARTLDEQELSLFKFNDTSEDENMQLTCEGMKQEYELGLFLKERYKNFLSEHYKSEEVYAYTSDTNRTKMSLELVLAGLYPPVGYEIWNPNLMWSPVPYIYAPAKLDILLLYIWKSQRGTKLRTEAYQTREFKKKIAKFSDFLEFLTSVTKINFYDDCMKIVCLYNIISRYESANLPLPNWYEADMKEKLKELHDLVHSALYLTPTLVKSGVGFLLKTTIENMNVEERNLNPRKIYLYSGHDINLILFKKAHSIEGFEYPEVGSGFIVEKLRDTNNNQVYVRLLFRATSGNLTTLKIGDHEEFCPIDDYLTIVEPVIPSDSELDEMLRDISVKKIRNILYSDPVVQKLHD